MAASVATVLGLGLHEVPDLRGIHWFRTMKAWADKQGLHPQLMRTPPRQGQVAVAMGEGPRGRLHAVVYAGPFLAHDPHPSRAGLVGRPHRYMVFAHRD